MHLRSHCEDPESELACNDDVSESGRSIVTAELASGRYYVISDSFSRAQSGDYVLSLEEAAVLLDVCPTTVRRYTNRGVLKCYRTPGNQRRFRLSEIMDFMGRRQRGAG